MQKIKTEVDKEEGYKPSLFVSRVRKVQEIWFKEVQPILEKHYAVDFNLNLDDVFTFHNPYNNREVPMYQIYVLKPQKNRYIFFKQKPIIIARIRLVGLFFKNKAPIFEATCKESIISFRLLEDANFYVTLKVYGKSSTEKFINDILK